MQSADPDPDLAYHAGFALVTGFFADKGKEMLDGDVTRAIDGIVAGAHFYLTARQSREDARVYVSQALSFCLERPVAIG